MLQSQPSPTLAFLATMGVTAAQVVCSNCRHSATLEFAHLPLPDTAMFPALETLKFVCTECKSREVHFMPDWTQGHAYGAPKLYKP